MTEPAAKKRKSRVKVPWQMVCYFTTTDEKEKFVETIRELKKKYNCDNLGLLKGLIDREMMENELQQHNIKDGQNNDELNSYYSLSKVDAENENIIMTTQSALNRLLKQVWQFYHGVSDDHDPLKLTVATNSMHVSICHLLNTHDQKKLEWKSSPYVGDQFLINLRIAVALRTSCLLVDHYKRFCQASGLGSLTQQFLSKVSPTIYNIVSDAAKLSMRNAIDEGLQEAGAPGLTIETDATHSAGRNASKTNTFALDYKTHKIVGSVVTTRANDEVPQRHETIGTKKMYEEWKESGVPIRCNVHDSNASVSKVITENGSKEQQDIWHVIKNDMKAFSKISKGPKRDEGKTWSDELMDKTNSVKNHFWYAIKNCGDSEDFLRDSLDAIVLHYQNVHDNCRLTSPCIRNQDYHPSKIILSKSFSISLLSNFIKNTTIYKKPSVVLEGLTTSYLESANGALRSFLPKKQSFGDENYKHRTNVFILDWNNNINRNQRRLTNQAFVGTPRENSGRIIKVVKDRTYQQDIWKQYISVLVL